MDRFENLYYQRGDQRIAGVDEVGRGALAGPLVVCLVILDRHQRILGLNDSKKLSAKTRERLFDEIQEKALYIDTEFIEVAEIDQINILNATKKAMHALLDRADYDHALIDAVELKREHTTSIIKGDEQSISIAAASIIAKVTRDRYMVDLDQTYPMYDFIHNKGYGTKRHVAALQTHGVVPGIHRLSFAPVAAASQLFFDL
jgi:ribonuclease HII